MPREIPLTRGKVALVDDADYEWLSRWKWHYQGNGYAWRNLLVDGKNRSIAMHRAITECPAGVCVDHINHDPLDNRRCNLRIATQGENRQNERPIRGGTSVFKGVVFTMNRWSARIGSGSARTYLGRFLTQRDAAAAYNAAALALYGEYACLNDLSLLPEHLDVPIVPQRIRS